MKTIAEGQSLANLILRETESMSIRQSISFLFCACMKEFLSPVQEDWVSH